MSDAEMTWTELGRRAENSAFNAGVREVERHVRRAADLALELEVEEGPLLTNLLFDRLLDLCKADNWSGRGNDLTRCYRDGFVYEARKVQSRGDA